MNDTFDTQKILELVIRSSLNAYSWPGRGKAPAGYLKGMALVYARVFQHLLANDPAAVEMAKPITGTSLDALARYEMNGLAPRDRLRNLFMILFGLGMRESSGNFCEGRDRSANNLTADTAEAGLFQMSWDITARVPLIKTLYQLYVNSPLAYGLAEVFHEGVRVTDAQLENYGVGPGADYQYMAKARPAFAVEAAAVGLRNLRTHWGPINRREVTIAPGLEELLRQIEIVVKRPLSEPPVAPTPKSKPKSWLQWLIDLLQPPPTAKFP